MGKYFLKAVVKYVDYSNVTKGVVTQMEISDTPQESGEALLHRLIHTFYTENKTCDICEIDITANEVYES